MCGSPVRGSAGEPSLSSDPAVTFGSWARPRDTTSRPHPRGGAPSAEPPPAPDAAEAAEGEPSRVAAPELQAGFCGGPRCPRQKERGGACAGPGPGGGGERPAGAGAEGRCPGPAAPRQRAASRGWSRLPALGPGLFRLSRRCWQGAGARAPGGATRSRSRVPRAVPAYCFPEKCREAGGGKGDLPAVAPRASIVVSNIKLTSSSGKKISLLFSFPPTTSSSPPLPPPG